MFIKNISTKHLAIILTFLIIVIIIMFSSNLLKSTSTTESKINVEKIVLDNGMEALIIPNNRVPAVMHMVWYKVGGIDEKEGKTGLAHYLEHLMFHGTEKYPRDEIDRQVSSFGGSHNAFTSYDFTAYYQNIPKEYLEQVMSMESDRMRGLKLEKQAAEVERDIVLEERLLRRDNSPKSILGEKVREALFGKEHPYGRPLIGYEDDIAKLTFNDAVKFYNNYYYPNNAVLVLAGDVTKEEVMPLIDKYYSVIPSGPELEPTMAKRVQTIKEKQVKHYDKNTTNISLKFSYLAPDLLSEDKEYCYSLSVLSYLLAGGQNSILYKRLVNNEDLAVSVSSSYSSMSRGQSSFSINVTLKDPKNEEKVKEIMDEELDKLKQGKIKKKELSIAKKLFLIETIYSKESYKSLAYILSMNYTTGISIEEVLEWDDNILSVSVSDIKDAATYVFQKEKFVLGYLIPEKLKEKSN